MPNSRCEIIPIIISFLILLSCNENNPQGDFKELYHTTNKWLEVEMLHQKFLAERKYNDSNDCIMVNDHLTPIQRDSILKHWSMHPEELIEITSRMIDSISVR